MKKPSIFVSRTSLKRERWLANTKAGLFISTAKGLLSYKAAACLYRAIRMAFPRASDGVRSGIWQVAFLSAYTNTIHNVNFHNNFRKGTDQRSVKGAPQRLTTGLRPNSKRTSLPSGAVKVLARTLREGRASIFQVITSFSNIVPIPALCGL